MLHQSGVSGKTPIKKTKIKYLFSQTIAYIELLHAHEDDLLCVFILQAQGPGSLLVSAMFGDNLIWLTIIGSTFGVYQGH